MYWVLGIGHATHFRDKRHHDIFKGLNDNMTYLRRHHDFVTTQRNNSVQQHDVITVNRCGGGGQNGLSKPQPILHTTFNQLPTRRIFIYLYCTVFKKDFQKLNLKASLFSYLNSQTRRCLQNLAKCTS